MTNTLVLLSMKLQLLPFQTKHGVQVMPCMKAAASVPPLMERGQNLLRTLSIVLKFSKNQLLG